MKTISIKDITEAGHDSEDALHILALCEHLDCEPSDLSKERYDNYGLAIYSLGSQQYAIGTDEEATKACAEYVKDTLWAFRPSFLADQTSLPEIVFEKLQELSEDANGPILAMVEHRLDLLTEDAISADGRGHFLSGYDGEENEVTLNAPEGDEETNPDLAAFWDATGGAHSVTLYIYRIN